MRVLAAALISFAMMGCGGGATAPAPAEDGASAPRVPMSPESKLCSRAYSQTVSALSDIVKKAGVDMPSLPDKNAYVAACVDAQFSEEQAKCLDPKWYAVDAESCAEALEPKKAEKDKLDKMFAEAMKASEKKPDEPKDAKAKGTDAPTEDVGAAVEAALGGQ